MTEQIVTANRLTDGAVVFLGREDLWSANIADAVVARDPDAAARLLATADLAVLARLVVAPYLIDVAVEGAVITPSRYRERIRAEGPSIRYGPAAAALPA